MLEDITRNLPLPAVGVLFNGIVEGKDMGVIGSDLLANVNKQAGNPLLQMGANMACPGAGPMMAIGRSVKL